MPIPGWAHRQAGAVMMGPDGRVYPFPDADQAAVPIPGGTCPTTPPAPADATADFRIRKGVRDALDQLPQMPNVMC